MKLKELVKELDLSTNTVVSILNRHDIPKDDFNNPEYEELMKAIYIKYGPFENACRIINLLDRTLDSAETLAGMNLELKDRLLKAYEKLEGDTK